MGVKQRRGRIGSPSRLHLIELLMQEEVRDLVGERSQRELRGQPIAGVASLGASLGQPARVDRGH